MSKLSYTHSTYVARVALKIRLWENHSALSPAPDTRQGVLKKAFSYKGKAITLSSFSFEHPSEWFLLFDDELDMTWLLREYLQEMYRAGLELPAGGVIFIDEENKNLIETNWDIGETEEWASILSGIRSDGQIIYTFSATDAAIELKVVPDGVALQNLNWEELPDRLVTSRDISPLHIFKIQGMFEYEVNSCLDSMSRLMNETHILSAAERNAILGYLSLRHRRQMPR